MDHHFRGGGTEFNNLRRRLAGRPPKWCGIRLGVLFLRRLRNGHGSGRSGPAQELLQELESANQQLREYAAQAEDLAAAQERNRLARELHDSATQTIFSMTLTAESSRILLKRDPKQVEPQLDRLNELAQGALEEMRTLIHELRPTAVAEEGLIPALHHHVDSLEQRDGLVVELNIHGDSSIGREQEEGLFRIVQESLNNVSKHARVDKAQITLQQTNGRVVLAVEDQGVGFDVSTVPQGEEHIGLRLSAIYGRRLSKGGRSLCGRYPCLFGLEHPPSICPSQKDTVGGTCSPQVGLLGKAPLP